MLLFEYHLKNKLTSTTVQQCNNNLYPKLKIICHRGTSEVDIENFFESMLSLIPSLVGMTKGEEIDRKTLCLKYAKTGFVATARDFDWTLEQSNFLDKRLTNDLSEETMFWFDECSLAISCFSSFVIGGLLGLYITQKWDDKTFMLYDAHLAGNNMINNQNICSKLANV